MILTAIKKEKLKFMDFENRFGLLNLRQLHHLFKKEIISCEESNQISGFEMHFLRRL